MEKQQKESYAEPVLVSHDMLRDITGVTSGVKTYEKVQQEKPGTE